MNLKIAKRYETLARNSLDGIMMANAIVGAVMNRARRGNRTCLKILKEAGVLE